MHLTAVLALALLQVPAAATGEYFGVRPGMTRRAEVDLLLGEPRRAISKTEFEYAPPHGVDDTSRLVVTFFDDTGEVARLDVHLRAALSPEPLRSQFGTRVLTLPRPDGTQEEFFFPNLFGLVLDGSATPPMATAISYLSRRYVADIYAERYNELIRAGRTAEARIETDKALLIAPEYARSHAALAAFHEVTESWAAAAAAYRAAIATAYPPRIVGRSHSRLGELLWQRLDDAGTAEEQLRLGVEVAPDLAETWVRYGRFLNRHERPAEARPLLERALALDPESIPTVAELADALYGLDDFNAALPHYERLGAWLQDGAGQDASDQLRDDILFRLAYCLARDDQLERSNELYRRYVEFNPQSRGAYLNLGNGYGKLGQFAEAVATYRRALEFVPDDFGINQALGNAMLGLGDYQAALQQAQHTLGLQAGHSGQMVNIARAYAALGKKGECFNWLRRAVAAGYRDVGFLAADELLARYRGERDFREIIQELR